VTSRTGVGHAGTVLGSGATTAFLIGRLAQEGRHPLVVLQAWPGRWRGLGGLHAFAVDADRLWLAQPRLLGEPAMASVPLTEVRDVLVHDRAPRGGLGGSDVVRLDIELIGRTLRYTTQDDAETCFRFVDALRNGRPRS